MHPAQLSEQQLLTQCVQRALRRGGPGGQHRNKVQTAVSLLHTPTGIVAEANERRSQIDNRRNAIFRLRLALAVQHRESPAEVGDLPSPLWKSRAVGNRLTVSATHDDYPALLSELIDWLSANSFDISSAAEHFKVSVSQLAKLLRSHSPALLLVNAARERQGMHKLT